VLNIKEFEYEKFVFIRRVHKDFWFEKINSLADVGSQMVANFGVGTSLVFSIV